MARYSLDYTFLCILAELHDAGKSKNGSDQCTVGIRPYQNMRCVCKHPRQPLRRPTGSLEAVWVYPLLLSFRVGPDAWDESVSWQDVNPSLTGLPAANHSEYWLP
jgi:hypothetical protein